jgi:putative flippase GtrA
MQPADPVAAAAGPGEPSASAGARRGPDVARIARFLVVGGLSAAVDVGLLVVLREVVGASVPVAATIAFWAALLVNFALHRAWSFAAPVEPPAEGTTTPTAAAVRDVGGSFARYLVLVGVNYVATIAIITGGVALGVPYVVAKVAAIGFGAAWTYVAYARWVFA